MKENKINGKPIEHFYLEKDGITLTEKTPEMKLKDGLITKEEYNAYIVNQRQSQYNQKLDGVRAELLDDVLNSLASQGLLNESQMEALKNIQTTRANIKEQYPKQ